MSFVVVRLAAPQQNRQRLRRLGLRARGILHARQDLPFGFVEVVLDFLTPIGCRLGEIAQVHHAECDVARFVLRAEPIHDLFRFVLREELTGSEHRQHRAFAGDMQTRGHLGEVAREIDAANET